MLEKSKQSQRAGQGAVALQGQRDVIVNQGITPEQMAEIFTGIQGMIQAHSADAEQLVRERLENFENKLYTKIAQDNAADAAAFKDPDFQYVLRKAQQSAARNDNGEIEDALVNLVGQRMAADTRSSRAMILNQAIKRTGDLSNEHFRCLAIVFWTTRVSFPFETVPTVFERFSAPLRLLSGETLEPSAYAYLADLGLLSALVNGGTMIESRLKNASPNLFVWGVPEERFDELVPISLQKKYRDFKVPSDFETGMFRTTGCSLSTLNEQFKLDLEQATGRNASDALNELFAEQQKKKVGDQEMTKLFQNTDPDAGALLAGYNESPARGYNISISGIVLAHSFMTKLDMIDAKLDIWL